MQSCATISDMFDNFPLCLTSTLRVKDLLILYWSNGILKGARTEFSFEKTCCKRRRGCARVCTKHPRLSKTKNLFIYITEKSEWKSKQLTFNVINLFKPKVLSRLAKGGHHTISGENCNVLQTMFLLSWLRAACPHLCQGHLVVFVGGELLLIPAFASLPARV